MTIAPRLALCADGSTALVTAAAGRVAAFDVASGALRAEHPAEDVVAAALSAGGSALAVVTAGGELAVYRDRDRQTHSFPPLRPAAFAIADDGARAAVLLGGRPAQAELWDAGAGAPVAIVTVGDGGRGELQADGALSLLAVWLGDAPAGPAAAALLGEELEAVSGFPGGPAAATAVHAGRAWAVRADGVTAWTAAGVAGALPGTLRDRVALAPGGGHVLLHRAEADLGGGAARVLLRAFSLPGLEPAGEAEAEVAGHSAAELAVTDGLEVRAVRATATGEIEVEGLAGL